VIARLAMARSLLRYRIWFAHTDFDLPLLLSLTALQTVANKRHLLTSEAAS
jgi:hypothetical protein